VNRIQDFAQDLRYGVRMLRKSPGFSAAAVLTLALGIGANTAIFSIVDAVLLRSLPYPDSNELVLMFDVLLKRPDALSGISYRDFTEYRSHNRVFSEITGNTFHDLTLTGTSSVAAAIRQEVHSIDKELPVTDVESFPTAVGKSISQERFRTFLLGSFSAMAPVLAAVGIFGVVSYSASQRRQEIGIRLAFGAQPRDVLRLILGHGAKLALLGLGIGVVFAFLLTRLMASQLYSVSATDPLTFGAVAIVLLGVSVSASYIPARRALRVDPMIALRYQ